MKHKLYCTISAAHILKNKPEYKSRTIPAAHILTKNNWNTNPIYTIYGAQNPTWLLKLISSV